MDDVTLAKEASTGPSSQQLLEAEFGKRRRGIVGYVVGGLVLLGAGVGAFAYFQHQAKQQAANAAFGELSQCLLGDAWATPTPPSTAPSLAFRGFQLAAMGLPADQRGMIEKKPWPQRCAKSALRVFDAGRDAGVAGEGDRSLGHQVELLAKQLDADDAFHADLSAGIDATFAAAKEAGLSASPQKGVEGPPAEARPMVLEDLAKSPPLTSRFFSFDSVRVELHQGEDRTFLVQDATVDPPSFFCSPQTTGLVCHKTPKSIPSSHTLNLLGTAEKGGAPLLFAGDRGDAGIFRGDTGEAVDSLYAYGGWVAPTGTAFVLGWDKEARKPLVVSRASGEAKASRDELDVDVDVNNFFYSTQLLWDQVFVRGIDEAGRRVLLARTLDVGGRKLGPAVTVGELPEPGLVSREDAQRPHISGCRTKDFRVVRVKGRANDFLAFQVDGKWSKPHAGDFFDGRLTCGANGATVTFISSRGIVTETRCTSASCASHSGDLVGEQRLLAPRDQLFDVVTVDDRVVAAWAAGPRGGIRIRVAPAAEIAKAKDVVVLDDLVYDGKLQSVSSISDLGLVPGDGHAVLLLGAKSGVHAIRVGLDGSIRPEPIEWR